MKEIICTQGKVAIVDDADFEMLSKYVWSGAHTYPQAHVGNQIIRMHRLLAGAVAGDVVDHVNNQPYDCRRDNLRITTNRKNQWNRLPNRNRKDCPYKGVKRQGSHGWAASITVNGKPMNLGSFATAAEAAARYDSAARHFFGDFARLNLEQEPAPFAATNPRLRDAELEARWGAVDWNKSDTDIGIELGLARTSVWFARKRLGKPAPTQRNYGRKLRLNFPTQQEQAA